MPSLDDYCHRLKELANQLSIVDCPVTPNRLVPQLVRGLPSKFDIVASFINQQVPSFETARSMLQLEQQRKSMREVLASVTAALVAPPSPSSNAPHWSDPPPRPQPPRGGCTNRHTNNSRGQPRTATARPATSVQPRPYMAPYPPPYYPEWQPPTPYWSVPPCPYPTQSGWAPPWQPRALQWRGSSSRSQQPRGYGQAHLTKFDALKPTDIGATFQTMSLHQPDKSWYMDTGASSHLTADLGTIVPSSNLSTIRSLYVGNGNSIPVIGSDTMIGSESPD
ncbi:uncharacterized protein LOC125495678 [Beta vulgaris subsp. vulgaris]|uniref:uncharacterized protein LOC125495678 n=1 Tax=Beta vulgaris subsp. vulgaris TaxID=3555 RepID=UPI002037197B|nr:uncharacterized protein LOC125495678 [Beta vulgaris subsp. vulgaris]